MRRRRPASDWPTALSAVSCRTSWPSHMWMTLSAAQLTGVTLNGALKFRDTIAAAMTPEQIAEAQHLASEWDAADLR